MKESFVSPLLGKLARRAGVTVNVEPRYRYAGQIVLPDGTKRYFLNTNFDLNPLGASEIARDKAYTDHFLRTMNYCTLEGRAFFTRRWCKAIGSRLGPEAAYRYAKRLGFPVYVKPNNLSQGSGVWLVDNKRELLRAVRGFEAKVRVFLVQRPAQGDDYRIVVLDRHVISAYRRIPLSVVGDGQSTVSSLLRRRQDDFRASGRDTQMNMRDRRIDLRLRRLRLTRRSVPAKGECIRLLDNANLSTGGEAVDVTRSMHPSYRALAVRVTRDMGLRYCGVDIITDGDIRRPCKEYRIIELNAAPGIDHYASGGARQRRIVEGMYLQVLRSMLRT